MNKELRTMAGVGLILMFASFMFALIEPIYFGSNWLPESKMELLCDSVALFLCGFGSCLFLIAIFIKLAKDIKAILSNGSI